jgi:hypothetical protein
LNGAEKHGVSGHKNSLGRDQIEQGEVWFFDNLTTRGNKGIFQFRGIEQMAFKIGETLAVDVESTVIRDVPMIVIRGQGGSRHEAVMFPAHQIFEIARIVRRAEWPEHANTDRLKKAASK